MRNLKTEKFLVSRKQKEALIHQKAFTLWLTGLSGSGKSSLAKNLEVILYQAGMLTIILDGDNTRLGVNADLDFTASGRSENIRRVAEIAKLFNDTGIVVITAFISPFKADRATARNIIGHPYFVESYVDTPLDVCMKRDDKGLYNKAIKGELKYFTGISSPYEAPENPEIIITTENFTIDESVNQLVQGLIDQNRISSI